ncbi:MAG: type II and III secretion system protein family protein [Pseudomonadota bacterium]
MHTFRPTPLALMACAALSTFALAASLPAAAQTPPAASAPVAPATANPAPLPATLAQRARAEAARPVVTEPAPRPAAQRACASVDVGKPISVALGKSTYVALDEPAVRLVRVIGSGRGSWIGFPMESDETAANARARPGSASAGPSNVMDGVAETEITLLSPTVLSVVGRRAGTANVILQDSNDRCQVRDIVVSIDTAGLQAKLQELLDERGVKVSGAENAMVLTGTVSDAIKLDQVMSLATSYNDGKRVVNLLRVGSPQQVMLEVKIAEVSKGLLNRFGLDYSRAITSGGYTNFISGIIGGAAGLLGRIGPNVSAGDFGGSAAVGASTPSAGAAATIANRTRGSSILGIEAQNRDGVVRILAEPNIMAISGQSASFLSGGKIFIPVAQNRDGGGVTITLEEKEFGVGLKFTPTVLDGRINLKVTSEVSELSQSGSPFTTVGGATSVLPSMTTRRVDTTVQLGDGQSFAVAGLIKNNVTEALDKFPGLGDAPVVGALFRSTEFQNDRTELMFVVTPRLVRPAVAPITLPTDNHVVPTQGDVFMRGSGEGMQPATQGNTSTNK